MIGLGLLNGLQSRPQIRTGVEGLLAHLVKRCDLPRKVEGAADVELIHRRPVIQEHEKLDFRGFQTLFCDLQVGFILHSLKLQPVQIHLGNRAGFEPFAIYVQYVVVIRQVFPR